MRKKKSITVSIVLLLCLVLPLGGLGGWLISKSSSASEMVTTKQVPEPQAAKETSAEPEVTKPERNDIDEEEENEEKEKSINHEIQTAIAAVVEEARSLFIQPDLKMVAVGDSLTQGVGDPTGNGGYIGILEEIIEDTSSAPSFEIKNYGKRGNRTDQLLKRLDEPKLSLDLKDADVVLITIGANDIMKVVKGNFTQLTYEAFFQETDDYRDRLEDIFEKIRSKNEGAPIYLVGVFNPFNMYFSNIPELDKIVEDWNAMGRETVEEYEDATFVPIHDLFENVGESYYADDHFHPNRRGYALMAERVFHYLEPELTEKQSELAENEETEQHVGQN